MQALLGQTLGGCGVEPRQDLTDELHVLRHAAEILAASHDQGLGDRGLDQIVAFLGYTILMGLAGFDPGRPQTVVV